MLVHGLRKYTLDVGHISAGTLTPARSWYFPHLSPQWAAVAAAALILLGSVFAWRVYFSRTDIDKGLMALNEAYKVNRPLEARVSGLNYAPFRKHADPVT